MTLMEEYINYIQEREWDEDPKNNDSFDTKVFKDALSKLAGPDPFNSIRHDEDPTLVNIYIKNLLGDYKGRIDTHNTDVSADPIGKDGMEKVKAVVDRYRKLNNIDPDGNARMKAKGRTKRSPDDDWDQPADTANIYPDPGDLVQAPAADGGGDGGGGE